MGETLHRATNNGPAWLQSGAKWILSIHRRNLIGQEKVPGVLLDHVSGSQKGFSWTLRSSENFRGLPLFGFHASIWSRTFLVFPCWF